MHKLDQESKVTSTKVTVQLHWLKMGPRGYFRPENSGSRRKKKKKTTAECTQWDPTCLSALSPFLPSQAPCSSHNEIHGFKHFNVLHVSLSFHVLFFIPKLLFLVFNR